MIRMSDVQRIEQAPVPPSPRDVAQRILAGFDRHYALFRYSAPSRCMNRATGTASSACRASASSTTTCACANAPRSSKARCAAPRRRGGPERADAANGKSAANGAGGADGKSAALDDAQTAFWQQVKQEFVGLLADHRQPECAETFFNSVSCRILHRDYFHNDFLFVRPAVATDYLDSSMPSYRVYYPVADGLQKSLIRMVADFGLALPFEDLPRDTRLLARAAVKQLRAQLPRHVGRRIASDCQIHALGSLFFRNKGAYIVGRLINQTTVHPSPWRSRATRPDR